MMGSITKSVRVSTIIRIAWLAALVALVALVGCGQIQQEQPAAEGPKSWDSPPAMMLEDGKSYTARFSTTKGEFEVELFRDTAPQTVNSFVFLARQKFYDNVVFHRIIETFMIQTGDPTGTGRGGPGYNIVDELETPHQYAPGIVAMANTGAANSGGSQFFICTGPDCANLNRMPNYTIFGKVSAGMDVVEQIAATPVTSNGRENSVPTEEVKIHTILIVEK